MAIDIHEILYKGVLNLAESNRKKAICLSSWEISVVERKKITSFFVEVAATALVFFSLLLEAKPLAGVALGITS